MIVPYPIGGGSGGSLKVVGSATRPATAEPGTIWVNDAAYDGCDIYLKGDTPQSQSMPGHKGYAINLAFKGLGILPQTMYTEIVNGLYVNIEKVYAVHGIICTALTTSQWNIALPDGSWLNT